MRCPNGDDGLARSAFARDECRTSFGNTAKRQDVESRDSCFKLVERSHLLLSTPERTTGIEEIRLRSSSHVAPTVHTNDLAGGELGLDEEDDGLRDLLSATPFTQRRGLFHRLVFLL